MNHLVYKTGGTLTCTPCGDLDEKANGNTITYTVREKPKFQSGYEACNDEDQREML